MRILYHTWLDVFSRMIRIQLAEKGLDADLRFEKTWERRPDFFKLNPAGEVPVLDDDGLIIPGGPLIAEYLEDTYDTHPLMPKNKKDRIEVKRLCAWMNTKFYHEVTRLLVEERVTKRFLKMGHPDGDAIRIGRNNMKPHIDYFGFLLGRRHWLAGPDLSLADIAAAAQFSSLDYLEEVDWSLNADVKDWYQRFKSRPSMRTILNDRVPGLAPPRHYSDLDF